jgi:site-specific recombinase XerD
MTAALAVIPEQVAPLPALPAADIDRAAAFARQDKAPATRAAYRADFAAFQAFCHSHGVVALPALPETVAAYLASEAEAGLKPSTISRRCAAIRYAHKLAGHEPPTNSEAVKATLRGIRRAWLDAAGIIEGAVFRPIRKGGKVLDQRLAAKSVCDLVKAYANYVGLDGATFGAHSLRSGFLTSAARRGASIFKMRDVSRHKSMDVLQTYVRDADLFVIMLAPGCSDGTTGLHQPSQ